MKINENKDPFRYWKYCTWGIIDANMYMESYLTQYIQCRCREENKPDPFKRKLVNFT